MIETTRPSTPRALLDALYAGQVFLFEPTGPSRAVVDAVREVLHAGLGDRPREAQAALPEETFFERIGAIRRELYLTERFHRLVRDVLEAEGLSLAKVAFDPLRLRAVGSGGHHNPRAAPVYYPHRDIWYGHPPGLVTCWIPLDDLAPEETFVFYPERFARPVPNDSEVFDYDDWVRRGWSLKIGWQDRDAGLRARYPSVLGEVDGGPEVGFACRQGQVLLFSGAQFHRTLPQTTGRTRFSVDLRWVELDDHRAGRGAPNVDNRSRGSAVPDYVQPAAP